MQEEVGLVPSFLSVEEVNKLKHMDAEKYRRSLV